jgi:serine/threonine-protein kinase
MSPEQCKGIPVDPRSDIYSLALVVFECLSGDTPFSKKPVGELLALHQTAPPPRLSQICPDMPHELDQPLLQALSKDPQARQERASELVRQLAAVAGIQLVELELEEPPRIDGHQVEGAVTGPTETLTRVDPRPATRSRRIIVVLSAALLLAALVIAGWALFGGSAPPPAGPDGGSSPVAVAPEPDGSTAGDPTADARTADSQLKARQRPSSRRHQARKRRRRIKRPRRRRRSKAKRKKDQPDEGPLIRF